MQTNKWGLFLRSILLLIIIVGVFAGIRSIGIERLQAIVEQFGVFGPVAYIGLRAAASVLAPFSSGPLQLASGILFGFIPAVVYSVVGSTLGYSISFWIARRYGREFVRQIIGDNIKRVDNSIDRLDSLKGLLTARLALYFAYDFVAYAAGLSRVRFALFFATSLLIGVIPTAATIGFGLFAADWSVNPAVHFR